MLGPWQLEVVRGRWSGAGFEGDKRRRALSSSYGIGQEIAAQTLTGLNERAAV